MKLYSYLNDMKEDISSELINLIKSKVKHEYIKMCIDAKDIPSRISVHFNPYKDLYTIEKSFPDRKPVDVSKDITELFNDAFFKIFGWKGRTENSVFAWNISSKADYFFPFGTYKYIYSPIVKDLWFVKDKIMATLEDKTYIAAQMTKLHRKSPEYKELEKSVMIDIINDYKYSERNLENFIGKTPKFEIMFNCKEYLLISSKQININKLLEALK